MSLREAAQAALEALDCDGESHRCGRCDDYVDRNEGVRKALRDALAEAEKAEPVAQRPIDLDDRGPVFTLPNPPAPVDDEEVIGTHPDGYTTQSDKREWWSGGAWLYPGDTVVVRRAVAKETPAALPELSDEDAQIARAWDRFTAELENPSPLTDEEILEIWSPSLDCSVQRPILGKNKILAFARAVLAAARGKG